MGKYVVKAEFIIKAESRTRAWYWAKHIMDKYFDGLVTITSVSTQPLDHKEDAETISINEFE
jgi:CO dehydrogenase/acetyl-CoA synthase delta subunit